MHNSFLPRQNKKEEDDLINADNIEDEDNLKNKVDFKKRR